MEFAKQQTFLFILIFFFSGMLFLILTFNLVLIKQSLVYSLENDNTIEIDKILEYGNENLFELNNLQKAIMYYDKVLAIDENNTLALNNKGLTLYRLGQYDDAIKYYDKVLAIDENNTLALNSEGLALYNLGQYDDA